MEPRRIYDYRSPHCQPHCTAASDPGYRSLRAFLLVKRQGAMDHLRKPWPHHARERSRNRRERSDVPHSARPMSLFRIGQSQAKESRALAVASNKGRPPGTLNRITRTMKEAAVAAAEELGQLPIKKWAKQLDVGDPNGMKG